MKFNGVEEKFFIPLAARIFVLLKFSNYFLDTKSLELENYNKLKILIKILKNILLIIKTH